jgi:hypothetical protein
MNLLTNIDPSARIDELQQLLIPATVENHGQKAHIESGNKD